MGVFEPREPGGPLIHKEDYGIIVRGPHPHHPGRMVLVMAGIVLFIVLSICLPIFEMNQLIK